GGRVTRTSRWCVRAGALYSQAGDARKRAASSPTHPSRSLAATAWNGMTFSQSRGRIGGSSCFMTRLSHDDPADGTEGLSVFPLDPAWFASSPGGFMAMPVPRRLGEI